MKRINYLMMFVLAAAVFVSHTLTALAANPTVSVTRNANGFGIAVYGLPQNTTSMQLSLTVNNSSFTSATMNWNNGFGYTKMFQSGSGASTILTLMVDGEIPLAANTTIQLGNLNLPGVTSMPFTATCAIKLLDRDLNENTFTYISVGYSDTQTNSGSSSQNSDQNAELPGFVSSSAYNGWQHALTLDDVILNQMLKNDASPVLDLSMCTSVKLNITAKQSEAIQAARKPLGIRTRSASYTLETDKLPNEAKTASGGISVEINQDSSISKPELLTVPVKVDVSYIDNGVSRQVKGYSDFVRLGLQAQTSDTDIMAVRIDKDGGLNPVLDMLAQDGSGYSVTASTLVNGTFAVMKQRSAAPSATTHWAYNDMLAFARKGIIRDINTFDPDKPITRIAFVDLAISALGLRDSLSDASPFRDVPDDTPLKSSVILGQNYKLVDGYNNGTFKPVEPITRQEVAKIVNQMFALGSFDIDRNADLAYLSRFADRAQIGAWATGYMSVLANNGIYKGDAHANINPNKDISNAEVVTILTRIVNRIKY